MSKKELAKRYLLFVIGLFVSALGVAVTKYGELGVSPISSVANVLSCKFTSLSLGTWLIIWNSILILGQLLILRKEFRMIQFLQVPVSFLFGYFTDFGMWLLSPIHVENYPTRFILMLCGIFTLGLGISMTVIANVVLNSGEAFVKAVSDKTKQNFGNIKVGFDVFCVLLSIVLSLLLFRGRIVGTREGTIMSALLTGVAVKFFSRFLKEPLEGMLIEETAG